MRKILLLFIVLMICDNCLYKSVKEELHKESKNNFTKIAEELISKKKYALLYRICKSELENSPKNYIAAYYGALSIQKMSKIIGADNYIEYIKYNADMPYEYKEKWLDIAISISNAKRLKYKKHGVQFTPNKFSIFDESNGEKNFTSPKVLEDSNDYYYLNESGILYSIGKNTKRIKKINTYKTKDFILLGNYLIFNDSVNLIKYDTVINEYELFYSFQKDDIRFVSKNYGSLSCVVSHLDEDNYLLKHVNFITKKITNLPDNCIAQSADYKYLIMNYQEYFEVFDLSGKKVLSVEGKFLGFGKDSNDFFYYNKNYLYHNNIFLNITRKLIFIPEYKVNKGFKSITNNKILFCFDDYMLLYLLYSDRVFLIKGNYKHIFKNGFTFTKNADSNIYFFSFFNNSVNLLFKDKDIMNEIIYSNSDSSIFLVKNEDELFIYELLNFFP